MVFSYHDTEAKLRSANICETIYPKKLAQEKNRTPTQSPP